MGDINILNWHMRQHTECNIPTCHMWFGTSSFGLRGEATSYRVPPWHWRCRRRKKAGNKSATQHYWRTSAYRSSVLSQRPDCLQSGFRQIVRIGHRRVWGVHIEIYNTNFWNCKYGFGLISVDWHAQLCYSCAANAFNYIYTQSATEIFETSLMLAFLECCDWGVACRLRQSNAFIRHTVDFRVRYKSLEEE